MAEADAVWETVGDASGHQDLGSLFLPQSTPHLLKEQGEDWEGSKMPASNIPKQAGPSPHWGLQARILFLYSISFNPESYRP